VPASSGKSVLNRQFWAINAHVSKVKEKFQKLAEQTRQSLKAQEISATAPGTILRDVQTLIDLIGPAGVPTKSKQGNLPTAALSELNLRLSAPIELCLERPLIRDYPNIAGIYILLRVLDLVWAKPGRLCLNQEALSFWSDLNPTEKYFALLEAWLFYAEDAVLGASAWRVFDQFSSNLEFLTERVSCRCWRTFTEACHTYEFRGGISTWNVQLQARLGLIEIQPRPLAGRLTKTRGWLLKKAKRTPWGEAVGWAISELLTQGEEEDEWFSFVRPKKARFGFLQPAFAPHFPDWKRTFRVAKIKRHPGRYIFKVVIEPRRCAPAWRRLAVPGTFSLDSLAMAILKAFDFIDMDHLYEFRFRDRCGKLRLYYHSYCDEGPWADEIDLEQADLVEKQVIKFRFDFGDNWQFTLHLERIEPSADQADIEVTGSEGKSPVQYPVRG
jgi:Plasmid pRiA4b ORF-3-like protein